MKKSWRRRRLVLWAGLLVLGAVVWLGVYAWDQGFTRKWRGLIAKELAKHGLRAEIGRLTLDPVEGLTARDVKLFDLTHRDQHLADIDRISLGIDVARLVNQEDFLRTLHLQKADVALPVDPGDPKSEWLTVRDLNARLVFQKDIIEIARAEGQVSGVLVKASGTVRKPKIKAASREEKERRREERSRQLREMRDRRGALRSVLRGLDRFRIPERDGVPVRAHKAELVLEVQGDLSDIDGMDIRAILTGGELTHRSGTVLGFEAMGRLTDGLLTLQRLEATDAHGALHAAASWKIRQADAVDVTVDCRMDLQALLRSALDDAPWLGEVVCYTPPDWSWDGRWLLDPAEGAFPVEGMGHVRTGRFTTRGVVFDGLEAKVALNPGGVIYVRDGVLNHHTGEVRGQALLGPDTGRYEIDWRMAPGPAVPFLPDGGARAVLDRFGFETASRVSVRMKGDRAEGSAGWRHAGRFQLRDFSYQGHPLREVAGEVGINPAAEVPLVFRNALLEMEDGTGRAREVKVDTRKWLLHLSGAEGTLMPAPLMELFLPPVARELEKYRFDRSPESRLEGVIDLQGLARSDYRIAVRGRSRCELDVAGRPMAFDQVSGTVHILGPELSLKLSGTTAPGAEAFQVLRLEETAPATFSGTFPLDAAGVPPASWQAEVRAPGRVTLNVLGRTWPLDQFAGRMESKGSRITGTGGAQLLDGRFGASLEFPDTRSPGHDGSIVIENVSFARMAAIMDPARKTEGRLTGTFSYKIPSNDAGLLTGNGEAKLEDANIFALPLLGPLSGMLDAVVPGENFAYSVARTATSTFTVAEGKVTLPDFEAATGTFRLKASGVVDYLKDRVDFLARVNLRGAPGMLLYPVSKLFEYAADGTMAEPGWHPRFLAGPFRAKPAEAGSEAVSIEKEAPTPKEKELSKDNETGGEKPREKLKAAPPGKQTNR